MNRFSHDLQQPLGNNAVDFGGASLTKRRESIFCGISIAAIRAPIETEQNLNAVIGDIRRCSYNGARFSAIAGNAVIKAIALSMR